MIAILSPAMNMKPFSGQAPDTTKPIFEEQAKALARQLRQHTHWELEGLLKINPELAFSAWRQYQAFPDGGAEAPALLSFHGLAYQNIGPGDFTREDLQYADGHVRILSALYGLLRPLDGIMPYRLDFMGRVKVQGKSLYHYWGDLIYRSLYETDDVILNLCSKEYSKLAEPYLKARNRWVSCNFLVRRQQGYRCLATESKMARGQMIRYLVKHRINEPEALQDFEEGGYAFAPELSDSRQMTFLRD